MCEHGLVIWPLGIKEKKCCPSSLSKLPIPAITCQCKSCIRFNTLIVHMCVGGGGGDKTLCPGAFEFLIRPAKGGAVYSVYYGAFPLHGTVRHGSVRLSSGRFAFPLQFSTAKYWGG